MRPLDSRARDDDAVGDAFGDTAARELASRSGPFVSPGTLTLAEVLDGLLAHPRRLPAKALYDVRGAHLFEEITTLREYYLTRAEREILESRGREIGEAIGRGSVLLEYGSGDAGKSRVLLPHLAPRAYVPIDVSAEQLARVAVDIAATHVDLLVRPIVADFMEPIELPPDVASLQGHRIALFLGSTIGNLHPHEALDFVRRVQRTIGPNGLLLLGMDLKKEPAMLDAAYNDGSGVTAAFNLNVLYRLRRELGAKVDPQAFAHRAFYDPAAGRIEMHLIAQRETEIEIAGHEIRFVPGDGIWTESSYKFTLDDLTLLGEQSGMELVRTWMDSGSRFALALYEIKGSDS